MFLSVIQTFPDWPDLRVLDISGADIVDPGSLHGLLWWSTVLLCYCGITDVHGMLHKRSTKYVFKTGLNHLITLQQGNFTPVAPAATTVHIFLWPELKVFSIKYHGGTGAGRAAAVRREFRRKKVKQENIGL